MAQFALTLLAVSVFVATPGCANCAFDFVSAQLSPDGRMKVVVYTRDCGATVRTATEVSVIPASAAAPQDRANVLVVRDDPDHPIQRNKQAIDVRLNWMSNQRLRVLFPRAARADERAAGVDGVVIEYGTY